MQQALERIACFAAELLHGCCLRLVIASLILFVTEA